MGARADAGAQFASDLLSRAACTRGLIEPGRRDALAKREELMHLREGDPLTRTVRMPALRVQG